MWPSPEWRAAVSGLRACLLGVRRAVGVEAGIIGAAESLDGGYAYPGLLDLPSPALGYSP